MHYKVNLDYFSGEVVKEILEQRLSKKMCAEFTNLMRTKGFIDDTSKYLPRLSSWVSDKIIFWQTDLGSLAVALDYVKKSGMNRNNKGFCNFGRNRSNFENRPYRDKQECMYYSERGHTSPFDSEKVKVVNSTNRFQFLMCNSLCWHCFERGHRAFQCRSSRIKNCDKYLHCELVCTCEYKGK